MAKTKTNADRVARLKAGIDAYAAEKADADKEIAAERAAGIPPGSVNFSVRLPTDIAVQMRQAASAQQLPTSAWLRRVIVNALNTPSDTLTDEHIERVVRRILAERKHHE